MASDTACFEPPSSNILCCPSISDEIFSATSRILSLSLSSITTLLAVFAPIPGAFAIVFASSAITAYLMSSADNVPRTPIAPFGPIPLTVIRSLNISSVSLSRKPKSCNASSFTCIYVYIITSLPTSGIFPITDTGTNIS